MNYIQVHSPLDRNRCRLSLYYLQRLITQPTLRAVAISLLRACVAIRTGQFRKRKPEQDKVLSTLRSDGIATLGQVLSTEKCGDILRHLSEKPLSGRGSAGFTLNTRPGEMSSANYALTDLVSCPHILESANSPVLLELARNYLGCTPTFSGLSARWSFPAESSNEVVQKFHRDSEDWLAFRIMVYLSEVDDLSGPHVYVKGTHLDRRTTRLPVLEDDVVSQNFGTQIVKQTGAPGSGFAVDTAGLHKGEVPKDKPRLLLSFQYSILPCFLYEYEPELLAELPYDPYINRLIAKSPRDGGKVAAEVAAPDEQQAILGPRT